MEALKAKMETIVNVFDEFDGNGDKIISIDESSINETSNLNYSW